MEKPDVDKEPDTEDNIKVKDNSNDDSISDKAPYKKSKKSKKSNDKKNKKKRRKMEDSEEEHEAEEEDSKYELRGRKLPKGEEGSRRSTRLRKKQEDTDSPKEEAS